MAKFIAKISGVAIRPGVSRNNREYTKQAIASAVTRAQARIAEGNRPLAMLTHHDAEDSSTHIVGRVTSLTLADDGSARYEAEIADTDHGRTIATLVDPASGGAYLTGVSIRGAWAAPVQRKVSDGKTVEYADDLELDGLDFTKNPGVPGAGIDSVTLTPSGKPRETADGRTLIFESVVEANIITEDAGIEEKGAPALKSGKAAEPPTPGASNYADPGYQDDKAKRYPLDTAAHAKAAWSYINQPKNAKNYTEPQLKRIKDRIRKALVKFGVKITAERYLLSPAAQVTETAVTEMDMWPDRPGSYCVAIDNGMFSINISSYQVDPADLEMCAQAAMSGVVAAYKAMDPDTDGDIDGPDDSDSSETSPDDDAMESADPAELAEQAPPTSPPADTPSAATATQKETGMAESTTPAAGVPAESAPVENVAAPAVAPVVTFSSDQFAQLLGALAPRELATAGAPAESAPTAPVVEAAPVEPVAVTESADEKIARLVAEGIKAALPAAVQEHVEANGVQRKGLVQEHSAPVAGASSEFPEYWPRDDAGQPKAVLSDSELDAVTKRMLPGAVLGNR
ncbi:MAG: hypothetical protein NVS3B12_27630 [Acidimicrobiales bacterium]